MRLIDGTREVKTPEVPFNKQFGFPSGKPEGEFSTFQRSDYVEHGFEHRWKTYKCAKTRVAESLYLEDLVRFYAMLPSRAAKTEGATWKP